jgi:2-desacetyl-2-hydroxyethyl bacteriochlorophyllide A dehydrogenase
MMAVEKMEIMKYTVFSDVETFSIEEKPLPTAIDDKVLIKVRACGLCGTDLLIYKGVLPVHFPYCPGHEYSGEVVQVGKKVIHIDVGDRVVVNPNFECGVCYYCRRGLPQHCLNMKMPGIKSNGGLAEYCLVPERLVYKISSTTSFIEATFVEPLSCCLHVINEANIHVGDFVAIIGGGTMGLLGLQLCNKAGAHPIILSEPVQQKRELAERLGATRTCDPTKGDLPALIRSMSTHGADIVVDNVGNERTLKDAITSLRRKGKLVLSGLSKTESFPFSAVDIVKHEIEIRGAFLNPHTFSRAIDIIESKAIDVHALITHQFALEDLDKALITLESNQAVKIVMRMDY